MNKWRLSFELNWFKDTSKWHLIETKFLYDGNSIRIVATYYIQLIIKLDIQTIVCRNQSAASTISCHLGRSA